MYNTHLINIQLPLPLFHSDLQTLTLKNSPLKIELTAFF